MATEVRGPWVEAGRAANTTISTTSSQHHSLISSQLVTQWSSARMPNHRHAELDHSLEMGCTSYFAHLPCLLDTCSGHDVMVS